MNNGGFLDRFKEYVGVVNFDAIRIGIASPEKIKALSYGEVKKMETINYRTLKPERDGLFCARIFGPQKDWECNCGKYRRMKHRGITCEKCGVEVIQSRVRRERMGHIKLVAPVCHIWFLKGVPSFLSIILDLPVKDLESIVYFDGYIVINPGRSPFASKTILSVQDYESYVSENPDDLKFEVGTGAQGIKDVLEAMDLAMEVRKIEEDIKNTQSVVNKHKLAKKLRIIRGMLEAGMRPQWMIMDIVPVIPPDIRPLVPLEGGRFASSDLNELYRRVLNRNIRLKRLVDLDAPNVIIKNEKRMLQEAVDALIDNGRRGMFIRGTNKRPLKSLSDILRGKQGRFRQNLLGKRVDYSARSVIVVEPSLKLHQCGLPKIMALELFKPYVYVELQRRGLAMSLRSAKKIVKQQSPEVWEALEAVVKDRPVMLNRAPTLHRLGFQGFYPILVEGKAIQLHPLVCKAYNADFDGDQMAVHVPLSKIAQKEVETLMFSAKNILSPANGQPVMSPTQDMVLGLYFLTKKKVGMLGEGVVFADTMSVIFAYEHGKVHLQAGIKVRFGGSIVDTTVGRVLLFDTLPKGSKLDWVNKVMTSKDVSKLVYTVHRHFGGELTGVALDLIKTLGFEMATKSGLSFGMSDVIIPNIKQEIIKKAQAEVQKTEGLYRAGAITNGERYNKVIQVWDKATDDVAAAMLSGLEKLDKNICLNEDGANADFNAVFMMLDSGAKGSRQQIRQLGAMRGLMADPSDNIIERPVISNLKEGLDVFEYFISTHGARKGLADTALKTADAGYLTRRLVDVAQDVVITKDDCGSLGFIEVEDFEVSGRVMETMVERAYGRVLAADVYDPISGKLLLKEGVLIGDGEAVVLSESAVTSLAVRSAMTCGLKRGICATCYGMDMSKGELVDVGLAVGVIAAQSIGEPGTQLTLKTFHIGGAASGLVEENFKQSVVSGIVRFDGLKLVTNQESKSNLVVSRKGSVKIVGIDDREIGSYPVEYGSVMFVSDGEQVSVGKKLFEWPPYRVILSDVPGVVEFIDLVNNITLSEVYNEQTGLFDKVVMASKEGRYNPCIALLDSLGNEVARYYIPFGAQILVNKGAELGVGQVIATMPREKKRVRDITGGLPRIVEFFEARNPKEPAVLADVDGVVEFGGSSKTLRRVNIIADDGEIFEYIIPKNKNLSVENGDKISAGTPITFGEASVHDILRIKGVGALRVHLVRGVQEVYMAQGVRIHDKHIEIIVKQMLRKVRVIDSGDTAFVIGELVDRVYLKAVNDSMVATNKKVAVARPVLMGITKASLGTESFLAAAAFQETSKVLAEAAIMGQVDYLRCLKSNIAIGRLMAAGTGISSFRKKYLGSDDSDLEKEACREEELEAGLDTISLG